MGRILSGDAIEWWFKLSERLLMMKVRRDVDTCIEVWTEILLARYQRNIDYLYAKGSSIKPWDGIIDYVPTLSDVDIHIKTVDDFRLFFWEL